MPTAAGVAADLDGRDVRFKCPQSLVGGTGTGTDTHIVVLAPATVGLIRWLPGPSAPGSRQGYSLRQRDGIGIIPGSRSPARRDGAGLGPVGSASNGHGRPKESR
jgi:hypothetical protein